jgi:hypothetical protein
MIRRMILVVLLAWTVASIGCGNDGQRGQNSQRDRPKPGESGGEK